eukprot:COSAG01_NODE_5195_length_4419_cov_5.749537_3_plen_83_part_00
MAPVEPDGAVLCVCCAVLCCVLCCVALCNNMQQSEDLAIAALGRKLHCILPTLVFGPVGAHGESASQIIMSNCDQSSLIADS